MTYYHGLGDYARSVKIKLTTTSSTTVYTVPSEAGSIAKIDSLWACNTGAATDLTVEIYDSSTSTTYKLVNRLSGGSQFGAYTEEHFPFEGLVLEASDEVRMTAGDANQIEAVLTLTEPRRQMA